MSQIARRLRAAVSRSPLLSQTTESRWTTAQRASRGRRLRAYAAEHPSIRLMIEHIDQHRGQIDADWNEYQTLVLEAAKPRT